MKKLEVSIQWMVGGFQPATVFLEVSPEAKLVHGDGQVPGLAEAPVGVTVVHGDQVHVAEDEAVVVVLLQRLHVAHVEQLGPVEDLFPILTHTHTRTELVLLVVVLVQSSSQTGLT